MALPASEVSLVAILLEDVLSFLRGKLVRVVACVMIGGMMWILESVESVES